MDVSESLKKKKNPFFRALKSSEASNGNNVMQIFQKLLVFPKLRFSYNTTRNVMPSNPYVIYRSLAEMYENNNQNLFLIFRMRSRRFPIEPNTSEECVIDTFRRIRVHFSNVTHLTRGGFLTSFMSRADPFGK